MNPFQLEEQINSLVGNESTNNPLFIELWNECKLQASKNNDVALIESQISQFSKETYEIQAKIKSFSDSLKNVFLVAVLGYWIKSVQNMDEVWKKKYTNGTKSLIMKKLIPFVNAQGDKLTLEEFNKIGHLSVIENIRCVSEWNIFQKEEAVQTYVQFSHSLARYTLNFVPPGYDPDRVRANNRFIPYEAFLEFVQYLSERDTLIAKLVYFGAPSLDEVLSMKRDAIEHMKSSIRFNIDEVVFPKHVIKDLMNYLQEKGENQKLVFANVRGAEVERAHLNHAFARASEKTSAKTKITPGSLMKLKNESVIEGFEKEK